MSQTRSNLYRFLELLRRFAEQQMTAPDFEAEYLTMFKTDTSQTTDSEFEILDEVFADVDDYVSDPELRQRAGGLDDEQLRGRVQRNLERLLALQQ